MLLMNPLAVPITLQVHATEDGEEQPLVFNIRDPNKILPITVRDPIKELQRAHEDLIEDIDVENNIEITTMGDDLKSEKSYTVNESIYSSEFEEDVMGKYYIILLFITLLFVLLYIIYFIYFCNFRASSHDGE